MARHTTRRTVVPLSDSLSLCLSVSLFVSLSLSLPLFLSSSLLLLRFFFLVQVAHSHLEKARLEKELHLSQEAVAQLTKELASVALL